MVPASSATFGLLACRPLPYLEHAYEIVDLKDALEMKTQHCSDFFVSHCRYKQRHQLRFVHDPTELRLPPHKADMSNTSCVNYKRTHQHIQHSSHMLQWPQPACLHGRLGSVHSAGQA